MKSKEIKEIKTDYELIGWASMLNDQQLIYLTFNDPSESKVDKRKLLFIIFLINIRKKLFRMY